MQNEFNIAPLSGGYMLTSIVGFLISAFYILPISRRWGFTFVLFFTLMFVAAMISMTYSSSDWPLKIYRKKA
jgi:formate hydrogenlyase subunit 3/multisubunit Na+/H+ antiporter MnhD subunit